MSNWSGSNYQGEHKQGWFHGKGRFTYANGVVYQGDFVKGQYHGNGTLIYPDGGYYKAKWQNGKLIQGQYFSKDHLKYEFNDWEHCKGSDRRFYQQTLNGIKPAGATQQTKQDKPHLIPQGTYDVGQGYYEPIKSVIYRYSGQILRTPSEQQVINIVNKCRYNPRLLDINGQQDKMIKKVIQKNDEQYKKK